MANVLLHPERFRDIRIQNILDARMVELVDTLDLKSSGHCVRAGSSPAPSTKKTSIDIVNWSFLFL